MVSPLFHVQNTWNDSIETFYSQNDSLNEAIGISYVQSGPFQSNKQAPGQI